MAKKIAMFIGKNRDFLVYLKNNKKALLNKKEDVFLKNQYEISYY